MPTDGIQHIHLSLLGLSPFYLSVCLVVQVCAALVAFQGDIGVQYMGCGAVGNLSNSNFQVSTV